MNMQIHTASLPTLTSSAVLASLNISVYNPRAKDREVESEVQQAKGTRSRRAASVVKNPFADCAELDAITAYAAKCRLWFNSVTLPWDDNGWRLLPMKLYMDTSTEVQTRRQHMDALVQTFLAALPAIISKQAFVMGAMFNREDYPSEDVLRAKFGMQVNIQPLPETRDFRVDAQSELITAMQHQYTEFAEQRVRSAMDDAWGRIRDKVQGIRDRLHEIQVYTPTAESVTDEDTGELRIVKSRKPKLYESMLDQGLALCDVLKSLNVTNDPKLEQARYELERALMPVDIDSLRESPEVQTSVKSKMDEILARMNGE